MHNLFRPQLYSKAFQAVSFFCSFSYSYPHILLVLHRPSIKDRGWKPRGVAEVVAAAFFHAGREAKGQEGNPCPSEAIIKPQLNRRQNVKRVQTKHTALFSAEISSRQLCMCIQKLLEVTFSLFVKSALESALGWEVTLDSLTFTLPGPVFKVSR